MTDTQRLKMPLIAPEQALKHITHNEALQVLDNLMFLTVEQLAATTPPVTPVSGDAYALAGAPTGDWTGQGGDIATFTQSGWRFATPLEGWMAWDKDSAASYIYLSGSWTREESTFSTLQNLSLLGVNATADSINKLAVRSNAALFNALEAGGGGSGDIRLTLNRETGTDVALLVFQSAYSARGELGINGDDDFSLKVSPDGSGFHTAMTVDKDNGFVAFNKMFGSTPSFPTIAAGVLTVETSMVVPAPESGTTDTIDTISGGFDGAILILTGTSGNTLTFSDGVGNLKLGAARELGNFEDSLMLVKRGTDWIELSFADNG
jgi:hypothetical protein